MPDLRDGESVEVQGSGSRPYVLKNVAGVYSCSCPAWRNQSLPIDRRTCKHLRKLRGNDAEAVRIAAPLPGLPGTPPNATDSTEVQRQVPALLLAETWDGSSDCTDWFLSEKLDGVRAYWDGSYFWSRQGNRYFAPDWFTAGLPKVPLDGELWLGRKMFQRAVSIVRRQDGGLLWQELRFLVFDAPAVRGPFEDRMQDVHALFADYGDAFAAVHQQVRCRDRCHISEELARVEILGGEGLMLRQPGSLYVAGRSATLLKVKTFREAEARVIGHQPGTGRHKGRLGALLVELPDGTKFAVGTGFLDRERESPPAIGAVITFRYQELSDGGVPRFPSFVRLRGDLLTTQPVSSHISHTPNTKGIRVMAKNTAPSQPAKPAAAPRRFTCVEGTSDKFWAVTVTGSTVTVNFGRNGTTGQKNTRDCLTADKAVQHVETLIRQKLAKGYVEVT